MTAHSTRNAFGSDRLADKRRRLMWSCAAAAIIVTAGTPRQARAQAFQGSPTLPGPNVAVDGSAARTITSPTTETITVATPKATINWTPFDNDGSGTIDFLPAGNIATFTNDPLATADFTVLNRIVPFDPSRPIALNGTVISQLQSISGTSTGGHVWFYSPGGIVVGATAVFNVGGLLLTVNDPLTFSATTNGFTGNFAAAANSTSAVTIAKGAQINATPENSYVALVAPRVVQDGTVNVNGAAAYVAGEDVTLTMNQGLFDIAVNVGTGDANGVVHTGETGGPSSTGAAGDNHRIYMVAVPKNQALTMLLSGNAGFTPAATASVDNGTIVLAAGSNVAEISGTLALTSPSNIDADLTIGAGDYTSDVRAFARGDIYASADDGSISFSRDVSLTSLLAGATGTITVGATNGQTLSIGRNLQMQTNGATFSSGAPEEANIIADGGTVSIIGNATMLVGAASDGTPGDAVISASDNSENGGSISIGGTTLVSTSASASTVIPDGESADSFAGNISIDAFNGGTITLANSSLFASANGQDNGGNGTGAAGDAFGGNINVTAQGGGDITINGNLFASVDGIGGNMLDGGLFGGSGYGGWIDMSVYDGSIDVTGNVFLSALGNGGDYIGEGITQSAVGGFGSGGHATIYSGGPGSITIGGATTLRADGAGGHAQTGGDGRGGDAGISGYDGTIALGPTINVSARGTGGNAVIGFGGNGGNGYGGHAFINANAIPAGVEQFASAATITGGNATIDASGVGGYGGAGNGDNIAAGAGGDGFGGTQGSESSGGAYAIAQVDGATLSLGNVTLLARGYGGAGGTGGNGQAGGVGGVAYGGTAQAGTNDFSQTGSTDGSATYGDLSLDVSATGGAGGAGEAGQGDGGSAFGGDALILSSSTVTAADATLSAAAIGGAGAYGGAATGGDAMVKVHTGSTMDLDSITATAVGAGGSGVNGGSGSGGYIEVGSFDVGALLTVTGLVSEDASGTGGNGTAAGFGGDGFGGLAQLYGGISDNPDSVIGGTTIVQDALVLANGTGGTGGIGGSGTGGAARVGTRNGILTVAGTLIGQAIGTGGNGLNGVGGTGTGGYFLLAANLESDTGTGTTTIGDGDLSAAGIGGDGGGSGSAGGDSLGGFVEVQAGTSGSTVTADTLFIHARGQGGTGGSGAVGGSGGDGNGGHTQIDIAAGATADLGDVVSNAMGFGGTGGTGSSGAGGDGGDGFGGSTALTVYGTLSGTSFTTLARGWGGNGGTGTTRGLGGSAEAGTALFDIFSGGQADFTGAIFVNASAFGGAGATGGDAVGGVTEIFVAGTLTAGEIQDSAGGFGGAGTAGSGGDGTGGSSFLSIGGGTLTVTGDTLVLNEGFGGNGTTSGGGGFGGLSRLSASNGAAVNLGPTLLLQADAAGGAATAGAAGTAEAGQAQLFATGSDLSGGDVTLSAAGILGGSVEVELAGSTATLDSLTLDADGTDTAGTVSVILQSDFGGTTSSLDTGAFTASADGATAGDIFVTIADGSSADLGVAQMSAVGAIGTGSINIDLGVPSIIGEFAGFTTLGLANTLLTAQSLSLVTSGDVNITSIGGASIDVAGLFAIDADGALTAEDNDEDGVIRADVIDWHANTVTNNFDLVGRVIGIAADLDLDVTTSLLLAEETINLSAGGDLIAGDLDAGLSITLFAGNDITAGNLTSGGTIAADAGGDLQTGDLSAGGDVNLDAIGNIAFGDAAVGTLDFDAGGTVTGGNIVADTQANGDAQGAITLGNITVGPGLPPSGEFSVGMASETSITVGDVQGADRVGFATLGDLTTGDIQAGSLFMTLVSGDISVGSITTAPTGTVYMADSSMFLAAGGGGDGDGDFDASLVLALAPVPTGGSITINGPVSTGLFKAAAGNNLTTAAITATTSIAASAGGSIQTAALDAGQTVTLDAGNDFTVGNVDAGNSATFTAGRVANFLGLVAAPTITVTSADINIVGQLGEHGLTDLVTLNAVSDGAPILIGDDAGPLSEGLQYRLTNDEDIHSDSVVFNVVNSGEGSTPDVVLAGLEMEGSLTAGGGVSHVELNTDGSVLVDGLVLYTNAGATDLLAINAGDIQVNTSTDGRIAMLDSSEERPSGILELNADNIWVGDQALLDDLNADPNFAGRDDRIGTNGGAPVPEGYLIAGGMTLSVGETLFVQNSGAANDFAGISVGDGGLKIRITREAPAQVVAYGRKFNADGSFTTGNAFFNLVDFSFDEGSAYTDLSEFNECLINTGCTVTGGGPFGPGPESILGPIGLMSDPEETIEGVTDGVTDGEDGAAGNFDTSNGLIDTRSLSADALIDEGVTSGGDNNQWVDPTCRPGETTEICPEDDSTKKQEPAQ